MLPWIRSRSGTRRRPIYRRNSIRDAVSGVFAGLLQDGWTSTFWAALFMFITILVVATGVSSGIERTCRILMPLLFLCILILVVYGLFQPGFSRAVSFVFEPDANSLEPKGVLEALGHAFFTLSLGMGAMITYGSYQRSRSSGLLGESIAIAGPRHGHRLAGLLDDVPDHLFLRTGSQQRSRSHIHEHAPGVRRDGGIGNAAGHRVLRPAGLRCADLGDLAAGGRRLLPDRTPATGSRLKAAWILGGAIFGFGILTAFANSAGFKMVSWLPGFGQSFFDTMDLLTSNWMLPLGGLLIALYAGWVLPARIRNAELSDLSGIWCVCWLFLIRFVAPILVIIVLLDKIGLIDVDEICYHIIH